MKVTNTIKIIYGKQKREELIIKGQFNFNWASDYAKKQSISGFIFMLNDSLVSWYLKRKAIIALLLIKVKYMALTFVAKKLLG